MSDGFDLWPTGDDPVPLLIDTDGRTWSRAELSGPVSRLVEFLVASGIEPSQTRPVPLVADSTLESVCRLLALLHLRVPALLLHPRWTPAEHTERLSDAGLVPEAWPALDLSAAHCEAAPCRRPEDREGPATQPLAIVFTSGSSSVPKAVVLSRGACLAAALASERNLPWHLRDRWQLALPLAHVGGLSILLRCLQGRRTVVLSAPFPSAAAELNFLREREVTLTSLVPTQLKRWLDTEAPCPPLLRAVLLGGAPAPDALVTRARQRGFPILKTYGLTEYASQVATQSLTTSAQNQPTNGKALTHVELRVTGGVLWLRGPGLFSGYFKAGVYRPATLDTEGWYCTNDFAELTADGELRILGRTDAVLISGGENVHPEDVEAALLSLPGVDQACVFGLPDEEWGTMICAAVVSALSEAEILSELRPLLSSFKRPKRVFRLAALPLTESGKVSRNLTAKQCLDLSAQDTAEPLA